MAKSKSKRAQKYKSKVKQQKKLSHSKSRLRRVVIKPGIERNQLGRVTQVLLNRLYISMISMILPIYLGCSIRNISSFVTVSAKTILNGTFIIKRKTDLKYSSCCGSVLLEFSHARFTV